VRLKYELLASGGGFQSSGFILISSTGMERLISVKRTGFLFTWKRVSLGLMYLSGSRGTNIVLGWGIGGGRSMLNLKV